MSSIAKSITIVNITDGFNAQQVLVDKLSKDIKIFHGHQVLRILGDTKLTGIEIGGVTGGNAPLKLTCDGVFVSVGRKPNTDLFKEKLELSKGRYIVVDDKLQTNIAGVFAAGDVVEKRVRQIITACADGAIAATYASL